MSTFQVSVRYSYKKSGGIGSGSHTSTTLFLRSQSETLVIQELKRRHNGCEIELIEIVWK